MGQPLIKSIPCPIRIAAAASPSRLALTDGHRGLTYAQVDAAIEGVVENMRLRQGDIVAVLADNCLSYALIFYAAFRLGIILMPLNTRLLATDWKMQTDRAGCRQIICGPGFDLPGVKPVSMDELVTGDNDHGRRVNRKSYQLDREALVIFSSGSSGAPRGAILTWKNLYYSALGAASALNYQPDDQWLAVLPFFHVGGLSILFRAALVGCGVCIMSPFDAERILETIDRRKGQYLSVVPTMLRELILEDGHNRLRHLKAIIVGGAPFDENLRLEVTRRKLPILTTYGMTETASMVTLLSPQAPPDKLLTAGKVLPYRELKITDSHGRALPSNQSGQIKVKGEVLFSRYLNESRPVFDGEGWFDTGDIGRIDREGFVTVTGRADNIIISGGENIDLNRIEQALATLDGITGVVVLAGKDKKWGERPVVLVQVSHNRITEDSIRERLQGIIPAIMIPDRIIIADELPRTGSGKYDRRRLREIYKDLIDGED